MLRKLKSGTISPTCSKTVMWGGVCWALAGLDRSAVLARKAMRASTEIPALWRRLLVDVGLSVRRLFSEGSRFLEMPEASVLLLEVAELEEPDDVEELSLDLLAALAGRSMFSEGEAEARRPIRFRLSSLRMSLASVPICSCFPIVSVGSWVPDCRLQLVSPV